MKDAMENVMEGATENVMETSIFDFDLRRDAIALHPARPPERGRMMMIARTANRSRIRHQHVRDLPHFLNPGDLVIVNNSRVIAAALSGTIHDHGHDHGPDYGNSHGKGYGVEVTLLPPPQSTAQGMTCDALVRPARKFKPETMIDFPDTIRCRVLDRKNGRVTLLFPHKDKESFYHYLDHFGQMPIPPYIRKQRPLSPADARDYQTTFATHAGSIAAPTAGLHFTPSLLRRMRQRHVNISPITLHVGPGTFLPVRPTDARDHKMEKEFFSIPFSTLAAIQRTRRAGGRIIAIGTTVCRTLESVTSSYGRIYPRSGSTSLFILPGWKWRSVDGLLTNFHLPRSTLFMLTCAFGSLATMHQAYRQAMGHGYRFYSYGDCCLLFRNHPRR